MLGLTKGGGAIAEEGKICEEDPNDETTTDADGTVSNDVTVVDNRYESLLKVIGNLESVSRFPSSCYDFWIITVLCFSSGTRE